MNYGKNQQALLKFLEKYPNQWHRIRRRKAIDAARRLGKRIDSGVGYYGKLSEFYVSFFLPQMLIKQN